MFDNTANRIQSSCDKRYPKTGYAWGVVCILLILAILSYTDRYVLNLLVDLIRQDLGISDVQISFLLGTAFAIVYGVFGIIAGILADRRNRRNLIVVGLITWSIGTVGCGVAPTFNGIFVARMIVGLGEAMLTPAAISLIGDYFAPSRRGTAIGFYMMAIPLGSGIAAIAGGAILGLVELGLLEPLVAFTGAPWRTVLVILGIPGFFLVFLMLIVKEPLRRGNDVAVAKTIMEGGDRRARLNTWIRVAPIFLGAAGMSLAVACLIIWGPSVLIRSTSMSTAEVGYAVGLSFAIGGAGGVLLGGIASDRAHTHFGPRGRIWVCLLGTVLALPCAMFGMSQTLWLTLLAMGLFIMFADWTISCAIAAILDVVPNRSRGLATSIFFFLNVTMGVGIGPTLVALISSEPSKADLSLGYAIFIVAAPVLSISLLAFGLASMLSNFKFRQPDRSRDSLVNPPKDLPDYP